MKALIKKAVKAMQVVVGYDTRLERLLRRHYRAARCSVAREIVDEDYILFWARSPRRNRVGIYLKGSCHLMSIFFCKPSIHRVLTGTCCILNDGTIADSRSDILLQSLLDLPGEWVDPVVEKLELRRDYFRPRLFERTFSVPGLYGTEEFSKKVVFLSAGADLIRNAYRHRQHGFLVDPGEWWLNQRMNRVLEELGLVEWFRKNFESVGKISVEAFSSNYARIIELVRRNTGAHVVVFNIPTVEAGKPIHNYQFVRDPQGKRYREFHVALAELSRKLDFPIVDVDRLLKRTGVAKHLEFGHFSTAQYQALGQEAFSAMEELGVFFEVFDSGRPSMDGSN